MCSMPFKADLESNFRLRKQQLSRWGDGLQEVFPDSQLSLK